MNYKAIKYRIYPSPEQVIQISKTFGSCRFVYNALLALQMERYERGELRMSKYDMRQHCIHVLKEDFPWLRETDKSALENSLFALNTAYQRFFDRQSGFPVFKSKRAAKQAYTTTFTNGNIAIMDRAVKLPKLGRVKAKIHRLPEENWALKRATVSESSGKYYVSVLFAYEESIDPVTASLETTLGLDYKVASLYVDSNAVSASMPKYYKEAAKKLAREQRRLSRKQNGSSNYAKQKDKVHAIHEHIANQRNDFLHKKSLAIAKQWDLVCIEDLSIKEQLAERKFRNFRKATLDNGWYRFTTMLQYKLTDRGKTLIKVGKEYPSSRICSHCGARNDAITDDGIRRWTCPVCGQDHDRDANAAINIRNEGWRIYSIA